MESPAQVELLTEAGQLIAEVVVEEQEGVLVKQEA